MMQFFRIFWKYIRRPHALFAVMVSTTTTKFVSAGVILLIGVLVVAGLNGGSPVEESNSFTPQVTTQLVGVLSAMGSELPLLGQIHSEAEATIQAESQGQIIRVNYELGDFVSAGTIIAELQNATERASVAQARATLQSATAALLEKQSQNTRTRSATQAEVRNAYRAAFITADDAIQNKTEPFFLNDRTQFPQLTIPIFSDDALEEKRAASTEILRAWESKVNSLDASTDMLTLLEEAQRDLEFIESFLNELASAANRQTTDASSLAITDTDRANLLTARSAVSTELATLIASEDSLRQALPENISGGTGELEAQIAASEAAVAQARGQVSSALAALEKTIIRAPISGTINTLNLKQGNFVSLNTPVVTIANNNALEIETFITAADRPYLAVGDTVSINGGATGIITNIAPGLDPVTNKIKVEIGVQGESQTLTHGDTVRVVINRGAQQTTAPEEITIPIAALKVETDRIVVFTVSDENTLIAHPIVEGPLIGSNIIIREGISPTMEIVLDARGLNEGDTVKVAR
jgi:RND family efflux transporter MFP subunit